MCVRSFFLLDMGGEWFWRGRGDWERRKSRYSVLQAKSANFILVVRPLWLIHAYMCIYVNIDYYRIDQNFAYKVSILRLSPKSSHISPPIVIVFPIYWYAKLALIQLVTHHWIEAKHYPPPSILFFIFLFFFLISFGLKIHTYDYVIRSVFGSSPSNTYKASFNSCQHFGGLLLLFQEEVLFTLKDLWTEAVLNVEGLSIHVDVVEWEGFLRQMVMILEEGGLLGAEVILVYPLLTFPF